MKGTDDKHNDHELKAYLDGRDGVSAAYRKTVQEEPPAALDRLILNAARRQAPPQAENWYAARKPYALAASVMIAIAGLSLYLGTLDEIVGSAESMQAPAVEAVEVRRLERAEPIQDDEEERRESAEQQRAAFATRALPPPAPTISAADAPAAPIAAAGAANTDALALGVEAPAIVIDGPLLESIEADAAAAQAAQQGLVANELEEIMVTGSRIPRRDEGDLSYRESREDWLVQMRVMTIELERRSGLTVAQRSAAVLENQLEEEIDLFLAEYPGTDIEAELELELEE